MLCLRIYNKYIVVLIEALFYQHLHMVGIIVTATNRTSFLFPGNSCNK